MNSATKSELQNKTFVGVFILLVLGGALRLLHLSTPHMDSDQAIFGLQSIHILKGEHPIFSWGYAYIGTLASYITAGIFKLFGISRHTLNGTSLLFFVGYALSVYYLAAAIFENKRDRMVALLFACMGPNFLVFHGVWARHGYNETIMFGTFLLGFSAHSFLKRPSLVKTFFGGFAAGLAWWTNFLILHYLPAFFMFLLAPPFLKSSWTKRGGILMVLITGIFFGSLPFWIYNYKNLFTSLDIFTSPSKVTATLAEKGEAFFSQSLPTILGTNQNYLPGPILSSIFWIGVVACCVSMLTFLLPKKNESFWKLRPCLVPLLFMVTFLFIYLKSGFSGPGRSARYAFPLYSFYPLVLAEFSRLLIRVPYGKLLRWAFISIFVISHLCSVAKKVRLFVPERLKAYQEDRAFIKEGIKDFRREGISHVMVPYYWHAAAWTFDAVEDPVFVHFESRYPPYIREAFENPEVHYLLNTRAQSINNGLTNLGFKIDKRRDFKMGRLFTVKRKDTKKIFSTLDISKVESIRYHGRPVKESLKNGSSFVAIEVPAESEGEIFIKFKNNHNLGGIGFLQSSNVLTAPEILLKDKNKVTFYQTQMPYFPGRKFKGLPLLQHRTRLLEIFFEEEKLSEFRIEIHNHTKKNFYIENILFYITDLFSSGNNRGAPIELSENKFSPFSTQFKDPVSKSKRMDLNQPVTLSMEPRHAQWIIDSVAKFGIQMTEISMNPYEKSYQLNPRVRFQARWEDGLLLPKIEPQKSFNTWKKSQKYFKKNHYQKSLDESQRSAWADPLNMLAWDMIFQSAQALGENEMTAYASNRRDSLRRTNIKAPALFNGKIEFHGYDLVKDTVGPGGILAMTPVFEIMNKVSGIPYIFIHFTDSTGQTVFQDDFIMTENPKRFELYPGHVFRYDRLISIPKNISFRGLLNMEMGIWYPDENRRLRIETSLPENHKRVSIGSINIVD